MIRGIHDGCDYKAAEGLKAWFCNKCGWYELKIAVPTARIDKPRAEGDGAREALERIEEKTQPKWGDHTPLREVLVSIGKIARAALASQAPPQEFLDDMRDIEYKIHRPSQAPAQEENND